jgi:hypothetical protein
MRLLLTRHPILIHTDIFREEQRPVTEPMRSRLPLPYRRDRTIWRAEGS